MDFQSKDFKKLQKKWYKTLKNKGFNDIEKDEDYLHTYAASFFRFHQNSILEGSKEEYYRLAGQFLYDYTFKDDIEKLIWELHSQGLGGRAISTLLKKKRISISKSTIGVIIKKLSEEMVNKCR